jgi:capsular exopolysaccharide synthesis family protein
MSRNIELLWRAQRMRELLNVSGDTGVTEESSTRPGIAAEGARPVFRPDLAPEINRLVHSLFLLDPAKAAQMVVFTDVDSDKSRHYIGARVAEALAAQVRGTVCVVDANLHSPSLHEYFKLENRHGLADALEQNGPIKEYWQQVSNWNLTLMTAGSMGSDWAALLASQRMAVRLRELRTQFDYVLVQAPPLGGFSHPIMLGQLADGVVMIVEANSTRRETAKRAKEQLDRAKVKLLGAVLNNRTFPIPEAIYSRL